MVEPNQPITLPPLSSQQTLPSVVRKPVGGKRIFPGSQQDIAKRSKKETALEREKRRMNEVKKRLLANPYSLTSSGASEFVFLPPQLQHLRNSCLLQYILLVITQMYTHTFMVTRTKV